MSSSNVTVPNVRLRILPCTDMTEIRVSDARFGTIRLPSNSGEVQVELPQGIYEVSFRDGTSWQSQTALLRPGPTEVVVRQPHPGVMRTAMPIEDLEPEPEPEPLPQSSPALTRGISTGTPPDGDTCSVQIVVREIRDPSAQAESVPSWSAEQAIAGLSIVAMNDSEPPAMPLAGGASAGRSDAGTLAFALPPGPWRLHLDTGVTDRVIDRSLICCPGWRTRIYLPLTEYGDQRQRRADLTRGSVRMTAPWTSGDLETERRARRLEANALQTLASGRTFGGAQFKKMLRDLLHDKFDNPMLGLYGGHLMHDDDPETPELLEIVAGNLTWLMDEGPAHMFPPRGMHHPDVIALRLRALMLRRKPMEDVPPVDVPPMLLASWRIILAAAEKSRRLIQRGSLAEQVAARIWGSGPWAAWLRPDQRSSRHAHSNRAAVGAPPAALQQRRSIPAIPAADTPSASEAIPDESADISFKHACALVDAALRQPALREWFRRASAPSEIAQAPAANAAEQDDDPITREEQLVAQAIHPVAPQESHQELAERIRFDAHRTRRLPAESPEKLASLVGLPPCTVERATGELAARLIEQGQRQNIILTLRQPMARPELIMPYDPDFLGDGFAVPMPTLGDALRPLAFADGQAIDYTHYSLVMHAPRKVAIFTAHNVDGEHRVRVSRTNTTWQMDERVGEFQLGPEVYSDNQIDRGHLVRREDVLWGSVAVAKIANRNTFFYTNAAPQHQNFNQDEWLGLEDWVLNEATDFSFRLCVFTGPVLRADDPVLNDLPSHLRLAFRATPQAQIPAAFWKVIVLRDATAGGDDLSAVAFAMKQSQMWEDKDGRKLLHLKVHQVTLDAIEQWTGLDFGPLKTVDELKWSEDRMRAAVGAPEAPWPIVRGANDIVYSRQFRRARGIRAFRGAGDTRAAGGGSRAGRAIPAAERLGGGIRLSGAGSGCRCGGGTSAEPFDARAAIEVLSRDVARLTEALAAQAAAAAQPDQSAASRRSVPGAPEPAAPAPAAAAPPSDPSIDQRVEAMVSRAPASQKESVRRFARSAIIQADVARGRIPPPQPSELTRIVGGDTVPPGGYPSCCCIGGPSGWFCTGVLIAPQVVLTAAHCTAGITRVMVGGNNVNSLEGGARIVSVRQVFIHPEYRAMFDENDINLLVIDTPAMVAATPLATGAELGAQDVELVGFGFNDPQAPRGFGIKRFVKVAMGAIKLSPEDDLTQLENLLGFHGEYEFVAGRKSLGRDTCNGDSGGPAYVRTAGGNVAVAGLTSRATREAQVRCGDGGIYVRPDRFGDWINSTIAAAGLPALA